MAATPQKTGSRVTEQRLFTQMNEALVATTTANGTANVARTIAFKIQLDACSCYPSGIKASLKNRDKYKTRSASYNPVKSRTH